MDEQTLAIIAEYEGMTLDAEYADQLQDRYLGESETGLDWAEQYIEDTGMLDGLDDALKYYFDAAAWLHDACLSGDISIIPVGPMRVVVLHN